MDCGEYQAMTALSDLIARREQREDRQMRRALACQHNKMTPEFEKDIPHVAAFVQRLRNPSWARRHQFSWYMRALWQIRKFFDVDLWGTW